MPAPASPMTVRRAEALVAQGELRDAADLILLEDGRRTDLSSPHVDPAEVEAQFILAKIALATRGAVGPNDRPEDNLYWAGEVVLPRLTRHWGVADPRIRTWRAVYLAGADWAYRDIVRMELELLAAQELLTAAEGWAALARLRGSSGGAAAWARCRAMARDPKRSCAGRPPSS
jgi:hypothetical protein